MAFTFWPKGKRRSAPAGAMFRQASHVTATAQGDELVLFDIQGERYFTLNAVGSRIWRILADGATCAEVAQVIRREYDVPVSAEGDPVEQDVARLVEDLYAAGLVVADSRDMPGHW